MRQFQKLEGRKPVQLEFPWPRQGRWSEVGRRGANHPRQGKGLRADNQDDPFSAPRPTDRVFNGMGNHRRHAKRKVVSLDLHDLAARVGPGNYDAYAEG